MSKKYTVKQQQNTNTIYYGNNIIATIDSQIQADKICNKLNQQNEKIRYLLKALNTELDTSIDNFSFNYTENFNNIENNTLQLTDKHTKINMDGNKIHITIIPPDFEPFEIIYYITGIRFSQTISDRR